MAGEEIGGPSAAQAAVLQPSEKLDSTYPIVKGPNLEEEHTLDSLLSSFSTIGFQASGVAKACEIIEKMRKWRLSDVPISEDEDEDLRDEKTRSQIGATIFLGFTSNLISSGLREVIVFLVKYKFISAIVTTAGGIEEDIIKCLGTTHIGSFHLDGSTLRKKGLNRIGNLLVPNDNYCKFEDWVMPILEKMRQEQGDDDVFKVWSPSAVCERLGSEINDESSFLYWAAKVSSANSSEKV
jgi:deoxyhypusine synthase